MLCRAQSRVEDVVVVDAHQYSRWSSGCPSAGAVGVENLGDAKVQRPASSRDEVGNVISTREM